MITMLTFKSALPCPGFLPTPVVFRHQTRLPFNSPSGRPTQLPTRVFSPRCVVTSPPSKPTNKPSKSPSSSSPRKPRAAPRLTADGDSLEVTAQQRILVSSFSVLSALLPFRFVHSLSDVPPTLLSFFLSYVVTDLLVGIYHHSVDNYGSADTPILGYQIEAFQGHHVYPWTITQRAVVNNLYRLTIPTLPQLGLVCLLGGEHTWMAFWGGCIVWVVLAQEAHRQAHMTRSAGWVRKLQDLGLIVKKDVHLRHHSGAHEGNYCILSGWWNPFLDDYKIFRRWEALVWKLTGVEPLCWGEDDKVKETAINTLPNWMQ